MPTLNARGCHAEEMKSLIPSHGFASYKLTYSTTIIVLQQLGLVVKSLLDSPGGDAMRGNEGNPRRPERATGGNP